VPPRKTRNVSLTPQLEAFIDRRGATGRYRSASEVVRAALRLLQEAGAPLCTEEGRPACSPDKARYGH
jgi:putative addiction module CopG family antidote